MASIDMNGGDITNANLVEMDFLDGTTDPLQVKMLSSDCQLGTSDPFGRAQLWYKRTNDPDPSNSGSTYAGKGSVFRMGSLTADGDPVDQISEGIVVYGQNSNGDMGNAGGNNFGFARIKPSRFQLRRAISGVQTDILRIDDSKLFFIPDTQLDPLKPALHATATRCGVHNLEEVANASDSFFSFDCSYPSVGFASVEGSTYVPVNLGDANYGASQNGVLDELVFVDGVYDINLLIDNVDAATFETYKFTLKETTSGEILLSQKVDTHGEAANSLKLTLSSSRRVFNSVPKLFRLYAQKIVGDATPRSFTCGVELIRIK